MFILFLSLLLYSSAGLAADPLDSPPFPSSDWVGPTPAMDSSIPNERGILQNSIFGDSLDKYHIKVSGWVDVGANISTSSQSNAPMSYNIVPNSVQLDQLGLRIDKVMDTASRTNTDWGFRLTSIYGIDYRYTTAQGYFSNQLLQNNNLYGFDPLEAYVTYYIPGVAQGLVIKAGRYISPADIEAQTSPDNYMYSHSLMFTVDAYTYTGVTGTVKLSDNVSILAGAHGANDMSVFIPSSPVNGQLLIRLDSNSKNDSLWAGINSLGSNQFTQGHDNLGAYTAVWGHKFNDTFHMQTEGYYQWQYNAALGGTCNYGPIYSFGGGGGCGPIINGLSWSTGFVNYFQMKLNQSNYLSLRNDYLNDPQGQRTGYATSYYSATFGLTHHLTKNVMLRPEVRYERSLAPGVTPYNNGTAVDQTTISADIIFKF